MYKILSIGGGGVGCEVVFVYAFADFDGEQIEGEANWHGGGCHEVDLW